MALLLNYTNLELRIFIPATGEIRQFHNGKLEIDDSDPAYQTVMDEALSNPNIRVVLEHKGSNVVAKEAAAFACTACNPAQSFDNEAELVAHTNIVHLSKPVLTDEGVVVESAGAAPRTRRRRNEVEPIPAAKPGRNA